VTATIALSNVIAATALLVSLTAAVVAYYFGRRQSVTARQANQMPVLVDLFREHRSEKLANARAFVHTLGEGDFELGQGLAGLPADMQIGVRELMWFYDNLGALVAHGIVDLEPVAGYLGGSVMDCWTKLTPLVNGEREQRKVRRSGDPYRWQEYFQNLDALVREHGPERARRDLRLWRL
jgi:hypothetical protein